MVKRLCLWAAGAGVALLFGLAGCEPPTPNPSPPPAVRRLGEPVAGPTGFYLTINGNKVYFETEEDMRVAQGRLQTKP